MDSDPNNWYPEPVPMWNLQTPTIFVPPSPTLVNPPLSPPPHFSSHSIPPFQSPAFIPNPVAVQSCIDAFAVFQQGMNEASNDFRENMQKIQESLQQSRRLIRELRNKVPTASAASYSSPQYAPEDPTLPSPWRGLIDGSTGSVYYWNTATNQTQYEKPCRLTHPPLADPTQPIYLHRKQLRVLRRRVSMAATRRLFKAIRKPDLLSTVGKAPRTQVNCKKGLWAVKAHHGEVFSDIMEAIRQLCVGTETSTTNPSFSPLISDVTEQHAVLFSVTVADEVSLASPKPTSDDTVVPNVTTNGAALACAHELDPEIVCLDLLPSVTEYDPSPMSLASDRAEDYVDLCYSSFTPMTDVVVDVSSAATVIGLNLADMVEPLKLETVESFRLDGLISNEENHRPDSAMVELIGMKNEWNKEFALVYQCCKLGNFTQARRVLWDEVKFSLDSSMITYASSSYGNIGEENLFATDKYGHMLVNVVMGAMTQPSLSQVSPTPHFNYQDVRRAFVRFLSAVIKPYNHNPLHSKVGEETWPLDDIIEKLNGDADTLFDSRSTSKITLDSLLVATDLTSQMVPLGGSGMDNKREVMPMGILSSLSWMAILLLSVIRMETDEKRRPLIRRWLVYCSLLCHFKEKVSTLAKYADLYGLRTVQVVTELDVMGSDTDEAPNIFLGQIGSSEYDRFAEDDQFLIYSSFTGFAEVLKTPRKGQQVQVSVFVITQPITLIPLVFLGTLDHAALPTASCFAPTCTELVQWLTHSAMILLPGDGKHGIFSLTWTNMLNVIFYHTLLSICPYIADIDHTGRDIAICEQITSSKTGKLVSGTFSSLFTAYSCGGKLSETETASMTYEAVGVPATLVPFSQRLMKLVFLAGALQLVIGLPSSPCSECQWASALLRGQSVGSVSFSMISFLPLLLDAPKEQLSTQQFSLVVSEANLESHMLEVTKMEFVLGLLSGVQLLFDRLIMILKSEDLVKATVGGTFLTTSGTTHIQVHAVTALPLKLEGHLSPRIIEFEALTDDYSQFAFLCASCSLYLHAKAMVVACWSCDMVYAAPYGIIGDESRNSAHHSVAFIQKLPGARRHGILTVECGKLLMDLRHVLICYLTCFQIGDYCEMERTLAVKDQFWYTWGNLTHDLSYFIELLKFGRCDMSDVMFTSTAQNLAKVKQDDILSSTWINKDKMAWVNIVQEFKNGYYKVVSLANSLEMVFYNKLMYLFEFVSYAPSVLLVGAISVVLGYHCQQSNSSLELLTSIPNFVYIILECSRVVVPEVIVVFSKSMLLTDYGVREVHASNLYLDEVVVFRFPCQTELIKHPGRFSVDGFDEFLQLNSEFSCLSVQVHVEDHTKGEYADDSNWQMVEYISDKPNSDGCGLKMRFYSFLIAAFWWLGQTCREQLCVFTAIHTLSVHKKLLLTGCSYPQTFDHTCSFSVHCKA